MLITSVEAVEIRICDYSASVCFQHRYIYDCHDYRGIEAYILKIHSPVG